MNTTTVTNRTHDWIKVHGVGNYHICRHCATVLRQDNTNRHAPCPKKNDEVTSK